MNGESGSTVSPVSTACGVSDLLKIVSGSGIHGLREEKSLFLMKYGVIPKILVEKSIKLDGMSGDDSSDDEVDDDQPLETEERQYTFHCRR